MLQPKLEQLEPAGQAGQAVTSMSISPSAKAENLEVEEGFSTPMPALKRRRRNAANSRTPVLARTPADEMANAFVKDEVGSISESVAHGSSAASEGDASDLGNSGLPCPGCFRVFGVSRCWYDPDTYTVRWFMPDGRGRWCKCCHTVWGTLLKGSPSLPYLENVIKADRRGWELGLMAFISLQFENKAKIEQPAILERKSTIEFLCRLIGIDDQPLFPSTVVALDDLPIVDSINPAEIRPTQLINLITRDGPKLAVTFRSPPQSWATLPRSRFQTPPVRGLGIGTMSPHTSNPIATS